MDGILRGKFMLKSKFEASLDSGQYSLSLSPPSSSPFVVSPHFESPLFLTLALSEYRFRVLFSSIRMGHSRPSLFSRTQNLEPLKRLPRPRRQNRFKLLSSYSSYERFTQFPFLLGHFHGS